VTHRCFGAIPLIALLCALVWLGACRSQARETLVIAVQPTATPEVLSAESTEIEAFLEQRLDGIDVQIRVPTLYAGVIEALRFGNAHAAFMSAWPAALARKHANAEVVLAEIREVTIGDAREERPYYFSYWVVPKDSPYHSLEELRGRRAVFPSPLSTSGYVMPMGRLVQRGLLPRGEAEADPKQFFGEVTFAGGYAQAWEAVRRGQADVTVIAGDVPDTLYRQVLEHTRVLDQQGPIPSHAVVFGSQLQEPLRSRLKDALLELGQPENRPLMRKFISGIFVGFAETTTDQHLSSLFDSLQLTSLQYTERLK
jgi:phosphonate transport system substrate-binding protein